MIKSRALLAILVSTIIVGSVTFGAVTYSDNLLYKNYLQAQYEMSLYNLISDVENMQVSLSKATITTSDKQSLLLFGEIEKEASSAKARLNNLPISHEAIGKTSKFLTQVADFSFSLVKHINGGNKVTKKQWKNIEDLKEYAAYLTLQLQSLQKQIIAGDLDFGDIKTLGREKFEGKLQNTLDVKFENISSEIQEYPSLIYDGPFSDEVLNIKPKILNQSEVSEDIAVKNAKDILGVNNVEEISVASEKKDEKIPSYSLSAKMKGQEEFTVSMDISKNGGKVVYMLNSREVLKESVSMKEASKIGNDYLTNHGYKNMKPLFSLKYDNVAVVNYVYVQDGVIVYSDQIKLKIALDNGEVIGIESQTYLKDHSEDRNIPKPEITADKAAEKVKTKLNIKNTRMVYIPITSEKEVLCYEYLGDKNGEKYLIYINAINGKEENILKILETPNGELTM